MCGWVGGGGGGRIKGGSTVSGFCEASINEGREEARPP